MPTREQLLDGTSIAQGFATDILAVDAASMTELPTKVSVEERIPCGAYRVPGLLRDAGLRSSGRAGRRNISPWNDGPRCHPAPTTPGSRPGL